MYVLLNIETGGYVAIAGHVKSYTTDFRYVRFFKNVKLASLNACENERVVEVK